MTIRSGAKVLGIIGGVIELLMEITPILLAVIIIARGGTAYVKAAITLWNISTRFFGGRLVKEMTLLWFVLILVSAILGLIGGAIAKGKPLRGGILMLVGGGFLSYWSYLLPAGLLLIGGVLSLVSWKQSRDKSRIYGDQC